MCYNFLDHSSPIVYLKFANSLDNNNIFVPSLFWAQDYSFCLFFQILESSLHATVKSSPHGAHIWVVSFGWVLGHVIVHGSNVSISVTLAAHYQWNCFPEGRVFPFYMVVILFSIWYKLTLKIIEIIISHSLNCWPDLLFIRKSSNTLETFAHLLSLVVILLSY